MLLSTEDLTEDFKIKFQKNHSILSLVSIGATVDDGSRFTKLEFKENIKAFNLSNFGRKNIEFNTIIEELIIKIKDTGHLEPEDIVENYVMKHKESMSVSSISENIIL